MADQPTAHPFIRIEQQSTPEGIHLDIKAGPGLISEHEIADLLLIAVEHLTGVCASPYAREISLARETAKAGPTPPGSVPPDGPDRPGPWMNRRALVSDTIRAALSAREYQVPVPTADRVAEAVLAALGDPQDTHARGYATAIAYLRDDARYMHWWSSTGVQPGGPVRQHLADYLETVGPDVPEVTDPEGAAQDRRERAEHGIRERLAERLPALTDVWLDQIAAVAAVAAEQALTGGETCGEPTPTRAARQQLDQALRDALPLSGGKVRRRLKALRRELARVDATRRTFTGNEG